MTAADVQEAASRIESFRQMVWIVSVVDAVTTRAKRLLNEHPLRAADSLQLAAALTAVRDQPFGRSFVCRDQLLADAAARRRLVSQVLGELDWIVLKALERDRQRRYQSALGLAEDLRRYRRREPVLAGPPSAAYRLRKWVARNRAMAAASAAALGILVASLVVISWLLVLAKAEAARADAKAAEAEAERGIAAKRADDVLSLSAAEDLQDLVTRADALWPACPENVAHYEAWLADARALIDGRAADPGRGIRRRWLPAGGPFRRHRRHLVGTGWSPGREGSADSGAHRHPRPRSEALTDVWPAAKRFARRPQGHGADRVSGEPFIRACHDRRPLPITSPDPCDPLPCRRSGPRAARRRCPSGR